MSKAAQKIGENPLDYLVPAGGKRTKVELVEKPERKRPAKERLTVHIPVDLIERVKDAAVALSGPPLRLTLAALAENALEKELDRLQKEHNKGKAFPKRESDLRGGRPIGS